MSKVFFVSLGCPKNLVDTEVLAGLVITAKNSITFSELEADVYVINSCGFLADARQEAEQNIKHAIKWKKKRLHRKVIVGGCLPQYDRDKGEFKQKYPEVDYWMGVDDIPKINEIIASDCENNCIEEAEYLYSHETPRLQLTAGHLAYLKIADGCNNYCSYCSIPAIRGKLRSRSINSIITEAKSLLSNGVKELIIIAQDITVFGKDREDAKENLTMLLKELESLEGEFFIRLLYTHPAHYSDELIEFLAKSKKVMPYLDMPLQHCNDRILKAMNRHVNKSEIENLLEKLRSQIPNLVLRTTFITGFPNESEEEFKELVDFVKKWKFERFGVFAFSAEEATIAGNMPGQIDKKIAQMRANELMEVQEKIMLDYQVSQIGKSFKVIVDSCEKNMAIGRSFHDSPDIDNNIIFGGKKLKTGNIYEVKIVANDKCNLIGMEEK